MKRLLAVLIIVVFSTVLAFAQDDQGNTNDPNDNDRANACYDGSMAEKCDTEWEWECGWYLIRFEYGKISREDFPAACASLLPPIIKNDGSESVGVFVGCHPFVGSYINFGNGNFLPSGVPVFSDAGCTTPSGITLVELVYADTPAKATAICVAHSFTFSGLVEGNIYHCG